MRAGETAGVLCPGAAEALGLPAGVPVVQGGIDSSIGMLGMGVARPGAVALMTGSSNLAMAVTPRPLFVDESAVNSGPDFLLDGYYTSVQGQAASGSVLKWFKRELCRDLGGDAFRELDKEAAAVPPGSGGLRAVSYTHLPHTAGAAVDADDKVTFHSCHPQYRAVEKPASSVSMKAHSSLPVASWSARERHSIGEWLYRSGQPRSRQGMPMPLSLIHI